MSDTEAPPAGAVWPVERIDQLQLRDKRVFLRVDFSGGDDAAAESVVVKNVERCLPTLEYARDQGARITVATHQGRPGVAAACSLEPVADLLAGRLGIEIYLPDDCIGDAAKQVRSQLRPGQVCLLENLAGHAEEGTADSAFARELAAQSDVFINEAPSLLHLSWASLCAVPGLVRERGVGFLCADEFAHWAPLAAPGQLGAVLISSDDGEELATWCTAVAPRSGALLLVGGAATELQRELQSGGRAGAEGSVSRSLLRRLEGVRCPWWVIDPREEAPAIPAHRILNRDLGLQTLKPLGRLLVLCTSKSAAPSLLALLTRALELGVVTTVFNWDQARHGVFAGVTHGGQFVSQAGENGLRYATGKRLPALEALSPNVRD